jgi:2'-5' RNA ligase
MRCHVYSMSSGTTEPRQRLFFALWPDDEVRAALDATGKSLLGKRIKRVPAANLHLTLAFAGSVTASVRRCLESSAGAIQLTPFDLTIDQCGHWHRPRIAWIGPTHTPSGLWSLVGAMRTAFESCGLQAETRPYQPHMTLARKISRLTNDTPITPVPWSIRSFSLIESVTDPRGVRYQRLVSWALEGQ